MRYGAVHRHDRLLKRARLFHLLKLRYRESIFKRELSGRRAKQKTHVCACTEAFADVAANRAYVCTLRALDAQKVSVVRRFGQKLACIYGYLARFRLDIRSRPRKLIELYPVLVQRGIGRRVLRYSACKTPERRAKFFLAYRLIARRGLRTVRVLRVGRLPERNFGNILLLLVDYIIKKPRRAPKAYRKHAARARVERPAVADALHAEYTPYVRHNVRRRQSRRLQHRDKSVRHSFSSPSAAFTITSRVFA